MSNDRFVSKVQGLSEFTKAPERGWLRVHGNKVVRVTFKGGEKVETEYTRLLDRILLVLTALFTKQLRFDSSVQRDVRVISGDLDKAADRLAKMLIKPDVREVAESEELTRNLRTVMLAQGLMQMINGESTGSKELGEKVQHYVQQLAQKLKDNEFVIGEERLQATAELFLFVERLAPDALAPEDLDKFRKEALAVVGRVRDRLQADTRAIEQRRVNIGTFERFEATKKVPSWLAEVAKELQGISLAADFMAASEMIGGQLEVAQRRIPVAKEDLDGTLRPFVAGRLAKAEELLADEHTAIKEAEQILSTVQEEQLARQQAALEKLSKVNTAHLEPYSSSLVAAMEQPQLLLGNPQGLKALEGFVAEFRQKTLESGEIGQFERMMKRHEAARADLITQLEQASENLNKEELRSLGKLVSKLRTGQETEDDLQWAVVATASLAGVEHPDGASLKVQDLPKGTGVEDLLLVGAAVEMRDLPAKLAEAKRALDVISPRKLFVDEAEKVLGAMGEYQAAAEEIQDVFDARQGFKLRIAERQKAVRDHKALLKSYEKLSLQQDQFITLLRQ